MKIIEGGVTAAKGFKAAAAAAEIKYKGRTDMAMVYSEVPCVVCLPESRMRRTGRKL